MTDAERRWPARGVSGMPDWRRLVGNAGDGRDLSALSSRTRDGIVVEPLYERPRDAKPVAGRGPRQWSVVQIVDAPDPHEANAEALADLDGGATGLSLRFAGAASAAGAGLPAKAGTIRVALADIDLAAIHLRLEPHAEGLTIARWLSAIAAESGTAPELSDISFGLDPVAVVVAGGEAAPDPRRFRACLRELSARGFRGPFALLDGRCYHEAGATEAQELGGILAAAVWWLHALDDADVAPADGATLFGASVAVDCEQFLSIAKLRALRLVWARLLELCEAPQALLAVHAETSRRMLTRGDPTTNLLRATLAAFAAGAGGADATTVLPHTAALGLADRNARALARNIQHLLIHEAHLHRVADPGAGSGAIEALTAALAERAWSEFQAIEREGGIVASLGAGAFRARIAEARAALRKEVAAGDRPLVGATVYPAPGGTVAEVLAGQDTVLSETGLAPVRLEELAEVAA
jgi:methylmalonyl-CoA mutase